MNLYKQSLDFIESSECEKRIFFDGHLVVIVYRLKNGYIVLGSSISFEYGNDLILADHYAKKDAINKLFQILLYIEYESKYTSRFL